VYCFWSTSLGTKCTFVGDMLVVAVLFIIPMKLRQGLFKDVCRNK